MQAAITVTALNNQIKSLLEVTFLNIMVEGEVSRVTYHSSGHLYFTLKDRNSAISCVMFRGNNQKLKFRVEEGMQVIINGSISAYTPRGSYQINCATMEPAGSGALALAYEQLKKKLESKGYFDQSNKKEIPEFPKKVAIITSKTGAAIQDMLRVAKKRWAFIEVILFDTVVQGNTAIPSIAANIKKADKIGADIIIVGRGGGSLEDLWAFNEEIVADAIFKAKTPVVSAVGHEIDFMISDFVSDLRAPTPSAAMELILPDRNEQLIYIDSLMENYNALIKIVFQKKEEQLTHMQYLLKQNSIESKIAMFENEIKSLQERYASFMTFLLQKKTKVLKDHYQYLIQTTNQVLIKKEQILLNLQNSFQYNDPGKKDKTGYAQIVKNSKKIDLDQLHLNEIFQAQNSKVEISAKVIKINNL